MADDLTRTDLLVRDELVSHDPRPDGSVSVTDPADRSSPEELDGPAADAESTHPDDPWGLRATTDRWAAHPALEPMQEMLTKVGGALIADPRRRDALQGTRMGHPIHPALSDLPIGFWTSAFLADLGGRRLAPAADLLIAAGVVTAAPTAITGLADWMKRGPEGRRVGTLHQATMSAATLLYASSLVCRGRGRRVRGVMTALAGATVATVGGYLGGRLAWEKDLAPAEDAGLPVAPLDGPAADAGLGHPVSFQI